MYCTADNVAQVCRGLRQDAPQGSRPGSAAHLTMQNWEASSFLSPLHSVRDGQTADFERIILNGGSVIDL